jgi:hypothetical protein
MRGLLLLVLIAGCATGPTIQERMAQQKRASAGEKRLTEFDEYRKTRPPEIQVALAKGRPVIGMNGEDVRQLQSYWDAYHAIHRGTQPAVRLVGERVDNGVKEELWQWCSDGKLCAQYEERYRIRIKQDQVVAVERGAFGGFRAEGGD